MKITLLTLLFSVTVSMAQFRYSPTSYTHLFSTNQTAAQARAYLGVSGDATNFSGSLSGDVTGTQSATVVDIVGGQTAAVVAAGAVLANAATNSAVVSTLVKRDSAGNFAGALITASIVNVTTAVTSVNLTLSGAQRFSTSVSSPNINGDAVLHYSTANGISLGGSGSTYDFHLFNKASNTVMTVATGTTTVNMPGALTTLGGFQTGGGTYPAANVPTKTASTAGLVGTANTAELVLMAASANNGANRGGSLYFAARRTDGGTDATYSKISGLKENATSGNFASYLALFTTTGAGTDTERLRIDSAGNVGIGITAPVYPLHVVGAALATSVSQFTGTATNQNRMIGVVKTITTTVANVGLTETNLMSEVFKANGLAATGDSVEILAFGTTAANVNSKTIRFYFGATTVVQSAAIVAVGVAWRIVGTVTRTGAATQVACFSCFVDGLATVTTYTTPTETLSGDITIKTTGTGGANSDITQVFHRSEFKPGNP